MGTIFVLGRNGEPKKEYMEEVAKAAQEAIYNKTGELYPLETKKDIKKLYKMSVPWALDRDEKTGICTFSEERLKDEIGYAKEGMGILGGLSAAFFTGDIFGMMASSSPATGGAISPEALKIGGALLTLLAVPIAAAWHSSRVVAKIEKLLKVLNPEDKAKEQLDGSPQRGAETFSEG
ncbi:MAG: hypothetical protein M1564_02405 [Candidatus Marsarchaeota archaeon]|jgi:hypothetical protein|nr:hypothetical protein [Candidatus Marsarchaeota archaeon]MCL5431127.1 hypothetical protein [Candidatus Marsarchaeota archaeon]